jgi:hypothetical protein
MPGTATGAHGSCWCPHAHAHAGAGRRLPQGPQRQTWRPPSAPPAARRSPQYGGDLLLYLPLLLICSSSLLALAPRNGMSNCQACLICNIHRVLWFFHAQQINLFDSVGYSSVICTTLRVQVERLGPATPLHRGSPHSSPMYDEFLPEEHETFLDDGTACNRTGGCVKAPGHQVCMPYFSLKAHSHSILPCTLKSPYFLMHVKEPQTVCVHVHACLHNGLANELYCIIAGLLLKPQGVQAADRRGWHRPVGRILPLTWRGCMRGDACTRARSQGRCHRDQTQGNCCEAVAPPRQAPCR